MAKKRIVEKERDEKTRWLEQMAGPKDTETDAIPIRCPSTDEPLDADMYWIIFRHPTGIEMDALEGARTREHLERETLIDTKNPDLSRVVDRRYVESNRTGPLMEEAFRCGLIVRGQIPARDEHGQITVRKLTGRGLEDWDYVKNVDPILFASIFSALQEAIWSLSMEEVVEEGEELSQGSELSTPEESHL